MDKEQKCAFIGGYMDCAIWLSSTDGAYEAEGQPRYDIDDGDELAPVTRISMMRECLDFLTTAAVLIESDKSIHVGCDRYERAGYDFWLTRCGHGSGYWDGDWPVNGYELTDMAQVYGNVDLYKGDDGMVYSS